MKYLHTMVRVKDLEQSMDFWGEKFGLIETHRKENKEGRFTLVFLSAPDDLVQAKAQKSPLVELTYNWPGVDGTLEEYDSGRNFGHLAYEVDDIYESCADLQAKGVTINRPPRDGRMAFIKSPDGISIELLQKNDALEPAEPWLSQENVGSW